MEQASHPRSDVFESQARLAFDTVKSAVERFALAALNRQIEACRALFREKTIIDVAILGQFKAGKSSFINSLVGASILPVGVIPVTTVITRIQYGPKPRALVTHFGGTVEEIDLADLESFVSEAKNPANEKSVAVVDIEMPTLESYLGLRLVDTPGLGSIFKYNTETSEEWLPEVGAAIVAISADRPLSDGDMKLIRELMTHTPRILLLLTKADLLTPEQQKQVVIFFRQSIERAFSHELPVYLYSTVSNTDLLKARVDRLLMGLSANRDAESHRIILHKITSLINSSLNYLDIALKTSRQADRDRDELKGLILTEKLNYEMIRSEFFVLARETMLQTRGLIAARLESKRAEFTKKLMTRLEQEMPSWKGNLWKLSRLYEEWLDDNLTREIAALSKSEHRHFFGTLDKAYRGFSRSLDLFRMSLERNIEQVLGIKLAPAEWGMDVPEPTHPDVAFTKTFDFGLDSLWFVIPMAVFRKAFERHFLKRMPGICQMHLSRLAYQWEVRINKAIEAIRDQALHYVQDELSTIDALLSKTAGQTEEISGTIAELRSQLEKIEAMGLE